jgi:hypothetical protein
VGEGIKASPKNFKKTRATAEKTNKPVSKPTLHLPFENNFIQE